MIGGTLTSTLLTLLVIPTVYEIMDQGREWLSERARRLFGTRKAHAAPVPEPGGGVD